MAKQINLDNRFTIPTTSTPSNLENYTTLNAWVKEIIEELGLTEGGELPASEWTELTVDIASAAILTLGSVPVELLPAPGAGTYYVVDYITLEYTHVTTPYLSTDPYILIEGVGVTLPESDIITQGNDAVVVLRGGAAKFADGTESVAYNSAEAINAAVTMNTIDSTDPTAGDGTLKAKLRYKIVAVG